MRSLEQTLYPRCIFNVHSSLPFLPPQLIQDIDISNSKATVPADKARILAAIQKDSSSGGGIPAINWDIKVRTQRTLLVFGDD